VAEPPRGNLVSLAAIQAFRMASGLAVNTLVMRSLGVEAFGVYGWLTILVGLCSFGSTMGMDRLLKREMARSPQDADRQVAVGLAAAAALSTGTLAAIAVGLWAFDGRPEVVAAGTLASAALGLQSLAAVPVSYFHATRRMGLGVVPAAAGRVGLVAATAGFLAAGLGLKAVFTAQILDGALTLGLAWWTWRRVRTDAPGPPAGAQVATLVRDAVPFGLNGLFGTIYLSADVLLLAWLRDDAEVGVYRAAVMLIALFPILAETLTTGIYPRMARHLGDRERAGAELRFATRVLLAASVPAAVGGMVTAEPLMVLLGGPAFAGSAVPFIIMAPLLPLRFLNNGWGMTLSALDRQADRTRGVMLAAVFNVAANVVVLPRWGAVGAASTTLATEVLLACWFRWHVRQLVERTGAIVSLARATVPALGMGVAVALVPALPVVARIGLGAMLYLALARATGAWEPADFARLRAV
jgi:O-antigen/teichoic acid export membrane protein